jgi:hypothetical protein
LKRLDVDTSLLDWVTGLKFLLKRSAEVMPRDSREGRPGPGITCMVVDDVGAAVTEVRKREKTMLEESFMIEL